MKFLRFVMFLFYRYYSTGGTYRIPYFSALCATVFLIYIHIFQLLIILDKVNFLPMNANYSKLLNYGMFALFLLPIFLIVAIVAKEKDLEDVNYDEEKIKKGGVNLIIYIVSSVVLLFVLMFAFAKT
jgi:hypothetical protein